MGYYFLTIESGQDKKQRSRRVVVSQVKTVVIHSHPVADGPVMERQYHPENPHLGFFWKLVCNVDTEFLFDD